MIGDSGHVKLAGNGFLELGEERLKSLIKTEPITDVYHVEQTPFARGKFASVRRLTHLVTGHHFAGKFLRRRRRAADTSRDVSHEMAVLDLCGGESQRVVRLVEVYETRTEVALVLELATGGELQHLLDRSDRGLPEQTARRYLRDTLLGLRDLHRHNVAHLDLKPQNLLLCKSDTGDNSDSTLGEVKLCDFGISRLIQPGVEVREIMGTPDYVAPEVLQYERLSLATDIWSIGVLAYVLLSGFSPFAGENKQETFLNISQAELTFPEDLFEDVSEQAKEFVSSCLVVHPGSRPTVDQCLEHPWLSETTKISLITTELGTEKETSTKIPEIKPEPTVNQEPEPETKPHTNGTTPLSKTDDCGDKKQISPLKPDVLTKASIYISFPDAPTTPKVSRKNHLQIQTSNSVLSLCKKFQHEDTVDCNKTEKDLSIKMTDLKKDIEKTDSTDNENFKNFENSVAYTMTCLLCSQCGGQCCHIPRKSLSMERGIIC